MAFLATHASGLSGKRLSILLFLVLCCSQALAQEDTLVLKVERPIQLPVQNPKQFSCFSSTIPACYSFDLASPFALSIYGKSILVYCSPDAYQSMCSGSSKQLYLRLRKKENSQLFIGGHPSTPRFQLLDFSPVSHTYEPAFPETTPTSAPFNLKTLYFMRSTADIATKSRLSDSTPIGFKRKQLVRVKVIDYSKNAPPSDGILNFWDSEFWGNEYSFEVVDSYQQALFGKQIRIFMINHTYRELFQLNFGAILLLEVYEWKFPVLSDSHGLQRNIHSAYSLSRIIYMNPNSFFMAQYLLQNDLSTLHDTPFSSYFQFLPALELFGAQLR